ncbi:hypothetical protein [Phyllobacterium sp. CL33Tsu]|uniref:hypothetical protein n=1 Tax=Phyllobacterium sp. CL33Tsu TaxID=1798191 RepID=UPI001FCDE2F1|nr:hypothetical protein [Phyllobacterium sp. CL33Tsu]
MLLRQARKVAVVISFQEYERLSRIPSLGRFLQDFRATRMTYPIATRPETAKLDRFT